MKARLLIVDDERDMLRLLERTVAGELDCHVDTAANAYKAQALMEAQPYDLVLLDDPREAIPPYDAVVLLAPGTAGRRPGLLRALAPLADAIDDEAMRAANRHVDVDGGSIREAAERLDRGIAGAE
jgi:glycine betaine/choline ABC-type transport system substrate-binding protein